MYQPYVFLIKSNFSSKPKTPGLISKGTLHTLISKVGDHSRGWPEGSFFDSYYTGVLGRALFLSLDCSTLPTIRTSQCWVLSKEVSSTIFKVFGMTRPGIEPRSPSPLANTLPTRPMSRCKQLLHIIDNQILLRWKYETIM